VTFIPVFFPGLAVKHLGMLTAEDAGERWITIDNSKFGQNVRKMKSDFLPFQANSIAFELHIRKLRKVRT